MNQPTQPYFHFDGNCREAMKFYQHLFGGELYTMVIKESPMKDQFPEEIQDQILHSTLQNEDFVIMASDMCGKGEVTPGNGVEISLNCSSEEEINQLFDQLSQDGTVISALNQEFWGALFGMVIDRFGIRWMLSLKKT